MKERQELPVGKYRVIGGLLNGKCQAVALDPKGKPSFKSVGPTVDEAVAKVVASIEASESEITEKRRSDCGFDVALPEEFKEALEVVKLTEVEQLLLRAHANATDATMTSGELAEAAGYASYRTANLRYGALGKKMGAKLGLPVPTAEDRPDTFLNTGYLAWGDLSQKFDDGWKWTMHPELVEALHELKMA